MTEELKPWPVDFDVIEVGRYFSADEITDIFGRTPSEPEYRLCLLNLKGSIEKKLAQRPVPLYVTAKIEGDGVRVLEHWENVHYSTKGFKRQLRGLGAYLQRLTRTDTSGFDDEQRAVYERNVNYCATVYLGAKKGKREARLSAPKADVPKALPDAG